MNIYSYYLWFIYSKVFLLLRIFKSWHFHIYGACLVITRLWIEFPVFQKTKEYLGNKIFTFSQPYSKYLKIHLDTFQVCQLWWGMPGHEEAVNNWLLWISGALLSPPCNYQLLGMCSIFPLLVYSIIKATAHVNIAHWCQKYSFVNTNNEKLSRI